MVIPVLKTGPDEKIESSSENGVFRNLSISSKQSICLLYPNPSKAMRLSFQKMGIENLKKKKTHLAALGFPSLEQGVVPTKRGSDPKSVSK